MNTKLANYPIYDLSGDHLRHVELIMNDNSVLKGRFVQFRVEEGKVQYLYPAEKYCFLPEEFAKEYESLFSLNKGVFKCVPKYIRQIGLDQLKKIIIEPVLV
ncbi:MAG: hypothetical protein ACXVDW_20265 [Bacteroidia bacterium]